MIESRPQPHSDHEIARICEWLRANCLSAHVTLRGELTFRRIPVTRTFERPREIGRPSLLAE